MLLRKGGKVVVLPVLLVLTRASGIAAMLQGQARGSVVEPGPWGHTTFASRGGPGALPPSASSAGGLRRLSRPGNSCISTTLRDALDPVPPCLPCARCPCLILQRGPSAIRDVHAAQNALASPLLRSFALNHPAHLAAAVPSPSLVLTPHGILSCHKFQHSRVAPTATPLHHRLTDLLHAPRTGEA